MKSGRGVPINKHYNTYSSATGIFNSVWLPRYIKFTMLMMSDIPQIERLLRIIQILSSGRKTTTRELYNRFNGEASLRTIQRDLHTLSRAGIPLQTEKTVANENAWFLSTRFRSFIPIPLETNEYLAAHILRASLKVFGETHMETEIQSLLKKIDQIVPDDVFLEANEKQFSHLFENYSAGTFDYGPFGDTIDTLIHAILNRYRCRVIYFNPYEHKEKTFLIEPEKMIYYSGGLYVIVYVRFYKSFILLAVQRIRELEALDEIFPQDHPFDPIRFWKTKFGLFSGQQVTVKLQFSKDIRHHIEGRTWHPSQIIDSTKNGDLIITLQVGITPELITWILGWGHYVTVLNPDLLKQEIRDTANKISALYDPV